MLCKLFIINIISRFEKDRTYIGYTMKIYADKIGKKEKTKETGRAKGLKGGLPTIIIP